MERSWTEPATGGLLGPDPGRMIRIWVTFLLRFGIGLSLLGSGLAGYYGHQSSGGFSSAMGQGGSFSALDSFMSGLPYLAIGLGLALILGFLTTASAIGAGFFDLIMPAFVIIQGVVLGSGGAGGMPGTLANKQFLSVMMMHSLPSLLTHAAMIWLSPLENNPFSVDALIFGRNEIEPESVVPEPIPEPQPVAEEVPPLQIGE